MKPEKLSRRREPLSGPSYKKQPVRKKSAGHRKSARSEKTRNDSTAWDAQAAWYDRLVGEDGSDYHKEVILPGTMRLLAPAAGERILDLGCGQGVFCRLLAAHGVEVTGVDLSKELIAAAKRYESTERIHYRIADACALPADLRRGSYDAATCILAVGNMKSITGFFQGAAEAVKKGGRLIVVIMHPCFRIPRQSHWQFDEAKKLQYRRIDRYLSPLAIPIITHPGRKDSPYTTMFHRPLHEIVNSASSAGWKITAVEEWTSNRHSTGRRARAENRARSEFPLFLAVRAEI
jgi:2-polyprenyl-3-methyl-5-hydroxy-6-metoxy-1,4-benzoquinol methylase